MGTINKKKEPFFSKNIYKMVRFSHKVIVKTPKFVVYCFDLNKANYFIVLKVIILFVLLLKCSHLGGNISPSLDGWGDSDQVRKVTFTLL